VEQLDALLRRNPQRAKLEIPEHLDGDLDLNQRPLGYEPFSNRH
jgi:hypothetical protein